MRFSGHIKRLSHAFSDSLPSLHGVYANSSRPLTQNTRPNSTHESFHGIGDAIYKALGWSGRSTPVLPTSDSDNKRSRTASEEVRTARVQRVMVGENSGVVKEQEVVKMIVKEGYKPLPEIRVEKRAGSGDVLAGRKSGSMEPVIEEGGGEGKVVVKPGLAISADPREGPSDMRLTPREKEPSRERARSTPVFRSSGDQVPRARTVESIMGSSNHPPEVKGALAFTGSSGAILEPDVGKVEEKGEPVNGRVEGEIVGDGYEGELLRRFDEMCGVGTLGRR